MYDPDSPEPEWIELHNPGDSSVDLAGWTVQDRTNSRPAISAGVLPPKGFLVLTKDTAALKAMYAVSMPLVQVSLPALNNGGDDVVLRDADGITVDSVSWSSSFGGRDGISLERITATSASNSADSWGSSTHSAGATPGARNSLAPFARDLAVQSISFLPDTRTVRAVIVNNGVERSVGALATLYYDANENGSGEFGETQSAESVPLMEPGDSITVLLLWRRPQTVEGEPGLLVVDHIGDERPVDNSRAVFVRQKFVDTGIVINEFVHTPHSQEPEWVELLNNGDFPVDLTGWTLHDAGSGRPRIDSGVILPGEFVVLSKDTAALRKARTIPSSSLLLPFDLPALNNSGDQIVLRNALNMVVDSLRYSSSWGGGDGNSVERKQPKLASVDSLSWGTSVDPRGATPGRANSLLPSTVNLALRSLLFDPESAEVHAVILNNGKENVAEASLHLFVDANKNTLPELSEKLESKDIPAIASGDSTLLVLSWQRPVMLDGEIGILLLDAPGDERRVDDTLRFVAQQQAVDTGLIVNELMYHPTDPEPEWLELYNRGTAPVDLHGWRVEDATGKSPLLPKQIVGPGQYVVLTSDTVELLKRRSVASALVQTGLPSFNNSGDRVLLRNASGVVVDSFQYASHWGGHSGLSLERKNVDLYSNDSASWISSRSASGATPGTKNSYEPILYDLTVDMVMFDTDQSVVAARVANRGQHVSSVAELILYFDANNDGVGSADEILERKNLDPIEHDGSTDQWFQWSRPLLPEGELGILVVSYAADQVPANDTVGFQAVLPALDTGVVVNEIMYDPNTGEPEWLELYNRADRAVKLDGWQVKDGSTSAAVLPDIALAPGEYLVITGDSTALRELREIPGRVLQVLLPALNNSGDQVLLINSSDMSVDVFTYQSSWGGRNGVSLERTDPTAAGDDEASWRSCRDETGGTPGKENSATQPVRNVALRDVIFVPQSGAVQATVQNTGEVVAQDIIATLYYDENANQLAEDSEQVFSTLIPNLAPDSSTTITLTWPRALALTGEPGIVTVVALGDENTEDNVGAFLARAQVGENGVVVNEFMFSPVNPEPEWIELYNAGELPVDLAGWKIGDAVSSVHIPQHIIEPGAFVVVAGDSALLLKQRSIPAPIIQIKLPILNNGEDEVRVHNSAGVLLDSVHYVGSRGGGMGVSLERRWYFDEGSDSVSWSASVDSAGATPGRENSVLPPQHNLALDSAWFDLSKGQIVLYVRNTGILEVANARVQLYHDVNQNGKGETAEELSLEEVPSLQSREQARLDLQWSLPLTDEGAFALLKIISTDDEREDDNQRMISVQAEPADTGLIITEIMYDPLPHGEGAGAEYIEVYNANSRPVPLNGWSLADGQGNTLMFPTKTIRIQSGSFGVVASDSAIFIRFPELLESSNVIVLGKDMSLNNSGDAAVLRNGRGKVIDSVHYSPQWHWEGVEATKGIALERLAADAESNQPRNWSSCVARQGGTPGQPNSRSVPSLSGNAELQVNPTTLSPDGDGFQDFVRVAWQLPVAAARIVLDVYDRWGRRVARPVNNVPSPSGDNVIWNGTDDNAESLPTGIYIVRIEAYDEAGSTIAVAQQTVTLARRL